MSSLTGLATIGVYTPGSLTSKVAALTALIADPDTHSSSGAQAGGGLLDEMSPMVASQLRVELAALSAAIAGTGFTQVAHGQYTATAADATADKIEIVTGLTDLELTNCAISIFRAGTEVLTARTISEPTPGTIRIADATYVTTAGDIVNWLARKA